MSKKLVARTAKLLSENRRFKNDTGVSIAYEHQPKDTIERKHGILFAIIEIINSLLTYFQSDQSVSESEGLIALDRELFALAKIVKRIGTPGYYQRVKLRYQLS